MRVQIIAKYKSQSNTVNINNKKFNEFGKLDNDSEQNIIKLTLPNILNNLKIKKADSNKNNLSSDFLKIDEIILNFDNILMTCQQESNAEYNKLE